MFNYNGRSRTLIREGYKYIIPKAILDNNRVGLQSADFMHRLKGSLEEIKEELLNSINKDVFLNEYIEKEEFFEYIKDTLEIGSNEGIVKKVQMRDLISLIYCYRYIAKEKN
jgi:uncharacterized protein YueI